MNSSPRTEALLAVIRDIDPEATTAEIVAACRRRVPNCTIPEIQLALRAVAQEQEREADALERYGRAEARG
jgi:hypothetical protein